MSNCDGCGDVISNEEEKAGSRNKLCVVCEYIRVTPQERLARREYLAKNKLELKQVAGFV